MRLGTEALCSQKQPARETQKAKPAVRSSKQTRRGAFSRL